MQLLQDFLQYLGTERRYSAHTLTAYSKDVQDFAAWAKDTLTLDILALPAHLQQLTHGHIRSYMGTLDCARTTLVRKLSAIRTFLRFHHRKGTLPANPAGRLTLPKKARRLPEFVQETQLQALLDNPLPPPEDPELAFVYVRDACMLELLYGCGLRRAELVNLHWPQIDGSNHTLRILGKGNKMRIVPIGKEAWHMLHAYAERARALGLDYKGPHFFLLPNGRPIYDKLVYRVVTHALRHLPALRKRSPHILRHSFATHLVNNGADLNAVKEMLGHSSLAATQVYVHTGTAQMKDLHKKAHPKG
ncbi:MAG: tyrosine-type recombinase/integrase [Bacteroidetes bacterium]|nr:tyrosine-type recombinase/integrase [Bacteroidota bacterium]